MKNKYLFGPVPSRRLGVSLGIDLVPFKTCTLDCVYCECGSTTNLTVDRMEYFTTEEIIEELGAYLQERPVLDYITFSGSGEPTLHSGLHVIIDFLKDHYSPYRIAVLTNGTLMTQSDVRSQLRRADLVIPSLDAASEQVFRKLNRPHKSLVCAEILSGLTKFGREYPGELWLEIMVVPGLNDTELELGLLKEAIREIGPDRVQLGTLDRPGAEKWVKAASEKDLQAITAFLGGAEIMGKYASYKPIGSSGRDREKDILTVLRRRPCTPEDIAHILQLRLVEVHKILRVLLEADRIESVKQARGEFYRIRPVMPK